MGHLAGGPFSGGPFLVGHLAGGPFSGGPFMVGHLAGEISLETSGQKSIWKTLGQKTARKS